MILDNYDDFIKTILHKLKNHGIDVEKLNMDHIGYQASSDEDYNTLKNEFNNFGSLVSEEIVGGRRVGIYKLSQALQFHQYIIPAIELIAPKAGQTCPSALEHVEFVLTESFDSFMNKYPDLHWDTTAINQPGFPMIKIKLGDTIQVKFHLQPILEIVSGKTASNDG
ncbi:VOC family protein [Candidatus Roizmanbacteria bacterium]|nr:VOC family protein [Candidatus Roizmanbacteria bacterium]